MDYTSKQYRLSFAANPFIPKLLVAMLLTSNALSPQGCKPFSCLYFIYNSILFFLYPSIFSLYKYFGVFEIDKKNLFLCKGYANMKHISFCKTQASFGIAWVGNLIHT
jgi:hypothetical protein